MEDCNKPYTFSMLRYVFLVFLLSGTFPTNAGIEGTVNQNIIAPQNSLSPNKNNQSINTENVRRARVIEKNATRKKLEHKDIEELTLTLANIQISSKNEFHSRIPRPALGDPITLVQRQPLFVLLRAYKAKEKLATLKDDLLRMQSTNGLRLLKQATTEFFKSTTTANLNHLKYIASTTLGILPKGMAKSVLSAIGQSLHKTQYQNIGVTLTFLSQVIGASSNPCTPGQHECIHDNGVIYCRPGSWRCDRESDCPKGDDEHFCKKDGVCPPDDFDCGPGDRCITQHWVCDAKSECLNDLDEQNCVVTTPIGKYIRTMLQMDSNSTTLPTTYGTASLTTDSTEMPSDDMTSFIKYLTEIPSNSTTSLTKNLTEMPSDAMTSFIKYLTEIPSNITNSLTKNLTEIPSDAMTSFITNLINTSSDNSNTAIISTVCGAVAIVTFVVIYLRISSYRAQNRTIWDAAKESLSPGVIMNDLIKRCRTCSRQEYSGSQIEAESAIYKKNDKDDNDDKGSLDDPDDQDHADRVTLITRPTVKNSTSAVNTSQ